MFVSMWSLVLGWAHICIYIYIPWGPSQQLNKWPFRKKEKKENTPLGSDFKSETIPGDYYFNGL